MTDQCGFELLVFNDPFGHGHETLLEGRKRLDGQSRHFFASRFNVSRDELERKRDTWISCPARGCRTPMVDIKMPSESVTRVRWQCARGAQGTACSNLLELLDAIRHHIAR